MPDDDMVEDRDIKDAASLNQTMSDGNIFTRWIRIAGWMVVEHDGRAGIVEQRTLEDFAWMYDGCVNAAASQFHDAKNCIFRV